MYPKYPEEVLHKCPCGNKASKNDKQLQDKFEFDYVAGTTIVECKKCGNKWTDYRITIF